MIITTLQIKIPAIYHYHIPIQHDTPSLTMT